MVVGGDVGPGGGAGPGAGLGAGAGAWVVVSPPPPQPFNTTATEATKAAHACLDDILVGAKLLLVKLKRVKLKNGLNFVLDDM